MAHKAAFKCQLPSTKSMLCIIAPSVRTVQVIFFWVSSPQVSRHHVFCPDSNLMFNCELDFHVGKLTKLTTDIYQFCNII